ncbi:DnaT-like ssDNA-binding domain-containing protein [Buttiauxella sp. B2]|uniref:DnaT-like ssDNA-binding domain-containing protein n=1 Tax=Buttiauxella sp. B2 TaxID=2587812 RepID=UPI001CB95476|nr:DnaT-like ssDNA-binding domain-containing protein [Buttiauxella sp. B2]
MPRFEAHNGQSAKRRAQDADRKRNVRKVSASEEDKKRTREEKRREDLKDKPLSSAGARERPSDPKVANQIMDNRQPSAGGTGIVGKFTMFEGWRPDDDFLLKAAQWGLVLTEPPPETVLAEFITYWQAEGKVFHHVQWEQKFAQALKRNQGRYKQTGDKRDETNIRADGYSGPWRGDAVEDSIVAMAEQLRANGRSESEIRHILGGNDRDLLGQMAGEERQGTVITLESGDFSAHR